MARQVSACSEFLARTMDLHCFGRSGTIVLSDFHQLGQSCPVVHTAEERWRPYQLSNRRVSAVVAQFGG
jgi:hypothetical protein